MTQAPIKFKYQMWIYTDLTDLLFIKSDKQTGSAGVSPARLLKSMPLSFFIHAGETPNAT